MSTKKYVSLDKLGIFLNNLKKTFAPKNHTHPVDSALSETSTNPVQNKVINAEFDAIAEGMGALENAIDSKSDADHMHTIESIDGLQEAVNNAADSKFYVVTFDNGSDGKYHADLTFVEIREKFEAGGNMVARIDGTDYIPLLSAAPDKIIFSGIYKDQSVSLTIDNNDVCTLITTKLANNSHSHSWVIVSNTKPSSSCMWFDTSS